MKAILRVCLLSAVVLMVVTSLVAAVPSARALSPVIWTTTSDFDNGTKSDPGTAWFSANGGCTTPATDPPACQPLNWINYPAAAYFNGRTYVVWQGDSDFAPYITYYDHATTTWAAKVRIGNNALGGSDDHGSPAIAIGPTGRIHVFCCSHDSTMTYFRSTDLESIATWTTMASPAPTATYPHPVYISSTLYLFNRNTNCCFGPWVWRSSTDGGTTWSGATTFFSDYAYFGGMEALGPKIFMTWTNLTAVGGIRHHAYVAYLDTVTGHMFCKASPDVDLGTAISQGEADASCRVEASGAGWQANFGAIHTDTSAVPYVIYESGPSTASTNWEFNFTRWTGSSWATPVTIRATDAQSNYNDFIVHSATDIEAYLTAGANVDGRRGASIEQWAWNGVTWALAKTVFTQAESGEPLNAPVVPTAHVPQFTVVFDEFKVQTIGFPTNPPVSSTAKLYAYGTGGVVTVTGQSSGTRWTETSTDGGAVASGSIALASVRSDAFNLADTDADTVKWNPKDYNAPTVNARSVVAGHFDVNQTKASGLSSAAGVVSGGTWSGTIDAQVNTNRVYNSATGSYWPWFGVGNEAVADCQASTTADGVWIRLVNKVSVQTFSCTNGVYTQVGTTTTITARDQTCLRIAGASGAWTTYYSTSTTCASWVTDETPTTTVAGSLYATISTSMNAGAGGTTIEFTFDDFQVTLGTVDAGGYRTSGSWTSPAVGSLGGVTLTYSGVSATNKIDKVEILQGTTVVQTDDTDIISGTSKSITFPNTGGGSVHVRVTLAGDGTGTPVLEAVQADPVECANGLSFGPTIFLVVPILVGAAVVLAVVYVFMGGTGRAPLGGGGLSTGTASAVVLLIITVLVLVSILAILFGSVWNNVVGAGC